MKRAYSDENMPPVKRQKIVVKEEYPTSESSKAASLSRKEVVCNLIKDFSQRLPATEATALATNLAEKILDAGRMHGKSQTDLAATALYFSCKAHNTPWTIHEISNTLKVKKKRISRLFSEIQKLRASEIINIVIPETFADKKSAIKNFAARFAEDLNLPERAKEVIKKVVDKMYQLNIMQSHKPTTSAACIIWAIILVKKDDPEIQRSMEEVAKVCQASARNFAAQFRNNLMHELESILPQDFASIAEIQEALQPLRRKRTNCGRPWLM